MLLDSETYGFPREPKLAVNDVNGCELDDHAPLAALCQIVEIKRCAINVVAHCPESSAVFGFPYHSLESWVILGCLFRILGALDPLSAIGKKQTCSASDTNLIHEQSTRGRGRLFSKYLCRVG
jgi:hypothetical protein